MERKYKISSLLVVLFSLATTACAENGFSSNNKAKTANNPAITIDDQFESEISIWDEQNNGKSAEHNKHFTPETDKENEHFDKSKLESCIAKLDDMVAGNLQIHEINIVGERGPLIIDNVKVLSVVNSRGPIRVNSAIQVSALENIRGPVTMNAGLLSTIQNIRGDLCLRVAANESVLNTRGSLVMIGQDDKDAEDDDLIKQIIDHRGATSISKINLDLIEDTYGTLVIYDSHVNVIKNHSGDIKLVNSKVDVIESVNGSIILKEGSEASSITDHKGKVLEQIN